MADNLLPSSSISVIKNISGKPVPYKHRIMAYNVYLKHRSKELKTRAIELASADVGISEKLIFNIVNEVETTGKIMVPLRRRRIRPDFYSKLSENEKGAIKSIVHDFFKNDVTPSVDKILQVIQESELIPKMSRSTLVKVLKKLGFERLDIRSQHLAPKEVHRYVPLRRYAPIKEKEKIRKKRLDFFSKLGDAEREAIKSTVLSFFEKNEIPSVDKVVQAIQENKLVPRMARCTMFKILKRLGYQWRNIGGSFQFLPPTDLEESVPIKNEKLGDWEFFLCN